MPTAAPREAVAAERDSANGPALASFLAAGIGAFAMGFFVLVNEAGIFAAPTVYAPAGGVSGRTTFAAAAWLIAWALLHQRWRNRRIDARRACTVTVVLAGLGILATFPPVWAIF
jgi:hypothetical protein